jgi:hypothetical protein
MAQVLDHDLVDSLQQGTRTWIPSWTSFTHYKPGQCLMYGGASYISHRSVRHEMTIQRWTAIGVSPSFFSASGHDEYADGDKAIGIYMIE